MVDNVFAIINEYTKTAPVDVEGLIRAFGLRLMRAPLDTNVAGMIEKNANSYTITVNEHDPRKRQRFTMAHELGHYIHHRDKIGDGIEDSRMYRNTGAFHNTKIGALQETQANQFAAGLLMPWGLINKLRDNGIRTEREMAERLDVSLHAMCIRLGVPYSD